MNVASMLNSRAATFAAIALVGAVVAYVVVKRLGDAADKGLDDYNAGTPYEDFSNNHGTVLSGVAAAGNTANMASGGLLAQFGGWLGRTFYGLTTSNDIESGDAAYREALGKYTPRKPAVRATQ